MKLSVIIPYYNGEKWIAKCLDSLLHQDLTADEYEIIVVDDGSTDGHKIVDDYVRSHTNIRYIWQENRGASAARNKGLAMAKGELVFFCDSDDFVAENVLGHLYDIAKSNDTDALFFGYRGGGEDVQPQGNPDLNEVTIYDPGINMMLTPPYKMTSHPWEFLIKREYIEKKQLLFNEGMIMGEDFDYYREMMSDIGRVGEVKAEVYNWVFHSSSVSHSRGKDLIKRYDGFIDGVYTHLCHLLRFRNHLIKNYAVPAQVRESLDNSKDDSTFSLLILYFRYYSLRENRAMMTKLKSLGVFPIHHNYLKQLNYSPSKRHLLKSVGQLMNIRPLWLSACALFHCLPKQLRDLC